jgi:hypothetical protein
MYQRHYHYADRGKWNRLSMCYYRFFGKSRVEEYFEFLKTINDERIRTNR